MHVDSPPPTEAGLLRRALLALVALTSGGLIAELLLLEHWESPTQLVPLALLAVVLVVAARAALRASAGVLRALRALMLLCMLAGVVGVLLHYKGNVEFELEREGALRGWALFVASVTGATPALAPGAMAQLGLVGLVATWRHPALRRDPSSSHAPSTTT
jgi:hypothetical protein